MLMDLINKIRSTLPNLFPVDARKFEDPLASRIEWRKNTGPRLSRASNKLIQKTPDLLVYKPSLAGFIMGLLFIGTGVFLVILYFMASQGSGSISFSSGFSDNPVLLMIIGGAVIALGVLLILQSTAPVAFDQTAGFFYRGRKQKRSIDTQQGKGAVSFKDIHAIQLLKHLENRSDTNNHTSRIYIVYEMNLVQHDGKRTYVNTYMQAQKARDDAVLIGGLIKVPVWDGLDG